jgi:16S rRNA (guanine527-N7)-methyltransferase
MAAAPLSAEGFRRVVPVSRETAARLGLYLDLLARWNARINLVAASTLADPWRRHLLDCAQLLRLIPEGASRLIDLGAGAGLPGLVLALMGVEEVHLVESDQRKAAFLREAARATGARVTIHACRIEALPPAPFEVITARALAPLPRLLALAEPFIGPGTVCLFPKGARVAAELTAARKDWHMEVASRPSLADPSGTVLQLTEVRRARQRSS